MKNLIEVYIDIYRNIFNENSNEQPYVYDNVRAVNSDEEEIVNEVITKMYQDDNSLLLDYKIVIGKQIPLLEENRKCFLNIQTLCFEFK